VSKILSKHLFNDDMYLTAANAEEVVR
jgi:hypothetical protein